MKNIRALGFTLIELLVIVAIVGILSAMILASLGTSRDKGKDGATISNMRSFSNQAELHFISNGNSYGSQAWTNSCTTAVSGGMFSDSKINSILGSIDTSNGSSSVACGANSTSYVIIAQLLTNTSQYWCVDSKGVAKKVTTAPGATAGTYLVSGAYGCYTN